MNLDDLAATIDAEEEEFEKDEDEGLEENLSNALSLLEDCYMLLDDVLDTRKANRIYPGLYRKIKALTLETCAFLHQYDLRDDEKANKNKPWWEKGEF